MIIRLLCIVAVLASATASPSNAAESSALNLARERLSTAQHDPETVRLAPAELDRAREAVQTAEHAKTAGSTNSTVDHLAYLATQRVRIAQEVASGRAAEAFTAAAASERDRMRLSARTNEANTAKRELGKAQAANAAMATAMADADVNAELELNRSQARTAAMATALADANDSIQREQARTDQKAAQVNDLESQLMALNARKTDHGMVVTLGGVLFDTGQSRLLPGGGRDMEKLADFFRRNPAQTASVHGYTDNVGAASANYDLSGRRANAVMAELVRLGVASDHLSAQAHGADMPTASNATAAGRQMNRRVEIVFAPEADRTAMR